jgi:hypothetical protein
MDALVVINPDGSFSYKPVKNSVLIKQKQSLNNKVDFDFQQGSPKNIFKPTIQDISKAIEKTAVSNPEAYKSLKVADKAYSEWADTFNNDYLKPFRDESNKNYSKLYKSAQDFDEFNQINKALSRSKKGQQISRAIKRDLVNSKLEPFFEQEKIHETLGEKFSNTLDELSAVLSPEELAYIKSKTRSARKTATKGVADQLFKKGYLKKKQEWLKKPENLLKLGKMAAQGIGVGGSVIGAAKTILDSTK